MITIYIRIENLIRVDVRKVLKILVVFYNSIYMKYWLFRVDKILEGIFDEQHCLAKVFSRRKLVVDSDNWPWAFVSIQPLCEASLIILDYSLFVASGNAIH